MEDVRFATAEDAETILALLRIMHSEIGLSSLSEKKVRGQIAACLDRGAIILATEGDVIAGTMGLLLGQIWYSDDWILTETWTFVHPDHRRSRHIRNMLEASKVAARRMEMPLTVSVTSDQRTAGKCRLFARHFEPIGQIFLQRAP